MKEFEETNIPMRFKVELFMNQMTFVQIFHAATLGDLSNQILNRFPKAKVLSIIGGG